MRDMVELRPRLDDRKARILRALVSQFVQTGEPVASRTLVERFGLGVSAATVRNEMAALEDSGYIYQPHTSAGRVPTDAGYRFFVDSFARHVRLPAEDAALVRTFFGEPRWELEDALRHTAALLSRITRHAAVVFAPALNRLLVRHVEIVGLPGGRAMLMVVTDTGRVENHVVSVGERIDDVQLEQAAQMLNRMCISVTREKLPQTIRTELPRFPLEVRDMVAAVAGVLEEEMLDRESDRVFLEGTSNIVDEEKFSDIETVREVISALEHRRLLLEILADALSSELVSVRIGSENAVAGMQYCSVVTAAYGAEGHPLGTLGVVGPTRMDYRRTIAAVHEVARNLGRMLSDFGM